MGKALKSDAPRARSTPRRPACGACGANGCRRGAGTAVPVLCRCCACTVPTLCRGVVPVLCPYCAVCAGVVPVQLYPSCAGVVPVLCPCFAGVVPVGPVLCPYCAGVVPAWVENAVWQVWPSPYQLCQCHANILLYCLTSKTPLSAIYERGDALRTCRHAYRSHRK